jgi:purine-binding chemotaxis protein CheW
VKRLVVFELEERRFAVPLEAADRVLPMVAITPLPGAPPVIRGVINVHGLLLPVADPRMRLGLPVREVRLGDRLLVVKTPRRVIALIVDEVQGVLEADDRDVVSVDRILPAAGAIAGIAKLPDGLILIQDMDRFLSIGEETALGAVLVCAGGER